jgi:hypothetical protein
MYSTESGSNSTDERESITITVVKQHGSSSQPTPAVKDH